MVPALSVSSLRRERSLVDVRKVTQDFHMLEDVASKNLVPRTKNAMGNKSASKGAAKSDVKESFVELEHDAIVLVTVASVGRSLSETRTFYVFQSLGRRFAFPHAAMELSANTAFRTSVSVDRASLEIPTKDAARLRRCALRYNAAVMRTVFKGSTVLIVFVRPALLEVRTWDATTMTNVLVVQYVASTLTVATPSEATAASVTMATTEIRIFAARRFQAHHRQFLTSVRVSVALASMIESVAPRTSSARTISANWILAKLIHVGRTLSVPSTRASLLASVCPRSPWEIRPI